MTDKKMTDAAHAAGFAAMILLCRVNGMLQAVVEGADKDDRVFIGDSVRDLQKEVDQFLWEPVGVPPMAPSMLAKIMGEGEAN